MSDQPEESRLATIDRVASITRLTVEEIRACVRSGHMPAPDRSGKYDLLTCVNGAFRWYDEGRKKPEMVSADELRNITQLTDQRHRQMANDGHFPPPVRGIYNLRACFAGMMRYYKGLHQRRDEELGGKRAEKLALETELLSMDAAERKRELISIEEMDLRMRPLLVAVRQRILSSTLTADEKDEMLTDLGEMLDHALTRDIIEGMPAGPTQAVASNLDQAAAPDSLPVGG